MQLVQKLFLSSLNDVYSFLSEFLKEFNLLFNSGALNSELQICGYNWFLHVLFGFQECFFKFVN